MGKNDACCRSSVALSGFKDSRVKGLSHGNGRREKHVPHARAREARRVPGVLEATKLKSETNAGEKGGTRGGRNRGEWAPARKKGTLSQARRRGRGLKNRGGRRCRTPNDSDVNQM